MIIAIRFKVCWWENREAFPNQTYIEVLFIFLKAPTICDIIILNIVGTKSVYKDAKFEVLTKDEVTTRFHSSISGLEARSNGSSMSRKHSPGPNQTLLVPPLARENIPRAPRADPIDV